MTGFKKFASILLVCIFCLSSLIACANETVPPKETEGTTNDATPNESKNVIYVDASAADSGDGSEAAPFKTVAEAQAKIRELKAGKGLPDGGVTVLLANGNYQPIAFTEADSGSEKSPVRYVSAEANGASITGGITLSADDFEPISDDEKVKLIEDAAKESVLKLDLTKYGITKDALGNTFSDTRSSAGYDYETGEVHGFAELFINTERMTLARYPNDTFLKTGDTDGATVFGIKANVKDRAANWDISTLNTSGYFCYDWSFQTVPVADMDLENLTATIAKEINYGIAEGQRYFFLNVFAETDMPGEYYIDRENAILYVYPTEDFDSASLVLSVSDEDLVKIDNASHISFEGLNVSAGRAQGFMISGSNINISDCKIFDIRSDAIDATGTNITIENNEIYNVGDNAVIITGGEAKTLTPSGNLVHNNYIHHWGQNGRTYYCATRIYGCGTVVSHNDMHDAPHEAIQYEGPNHIIEYNDIYNVCLETDDCGAIYAYRSLTDYGCIIRYNYIHEVGVGNRQALGIYMDDAESGQTIIGNVIANVTGHGINIGGGRDMIVENNLLINWNRKTCFSLLYDDRGQMFMDIDKEQSARMGAGLKAMQQQKEWLEAFPGYGDIIPFTVDYDGDYKDPMLSGNPSNSIVRNNMSYRMTKTAYAGDFDEVLHYENIIFSDYFKVCENNLSFQDYEFNDIPNYSNGDCTLAENSRAYQNGFEKIPFDEIGRIEK